MLAAPPALAQTEVRPPSLSDSLAQRDTLAAVQRDSLTLDSLRRTAAFETELRYKARDSIVFDLKARTMSLYGGANVLYQDKDLTAARIRVDWGRTLITAEGVPDSTGELTEKPVFKEGDDTYYTERVRYNYKTEKGNITYARTTQAGDVVMGQAIQRNPDKTFFIRDGLFTTCDHEHPHFYIRAGQIKMIPEDKIISGPLYMCIADVPIPLVLPFGFFPLSKKRTSGILLPEYGSTADRGFFFRNMGYYWAMTPYNDVKLLTTIFTNGSYQLTLNTNYRMRYRFDGNFNFDWADERFNQPGDPDYSRQSRYFIRGRHSQRITPLARLSADVNFGASNFLQRNSFNLQDNLRREITSNIAYQHSFPRAGWNLSASINHRQDLQRRSVVLGLPDLALNKDRLFPFKSQAGGSRRWYESIGVTYGAQFRNQIETFDSLLFTRRMSEGMRYGLQHTASANTNFKLLRHLNLTPSLSYREVWYTQRERFTNTDRLFDSLQVIGGEAQRVFYTQRVADTTTQRGFAAAREFGTSVALNTNLYGTLIVGGPRQRAFRHTMTPTLSYSFRPDFSDPGWGFYDSYDLYTERSDGTREARPQRASQFGRGIFGGPGAGLQQALNFSLQNQWEMRHLPPRAPTDTAAAKPKYTPLVDNLGASFSYNFAAQQYKLSDLNVQLRNNVRQGLLTLNLNGQFSPYVLDSATGGRIDRYLWQRGGGGWLRLERAGLAVATSLRSTDLFKADTSRKPRRDGPFALYQPFELPWNVSLSYTANLSRRFVVAQRRMEEEIVHSLNAAFNLDLTRLWKMRASTNYDFQTGKLGASSVGVSRDLHCWVMAFDAVPFGRFRRYMLTVNVKAQTLQDLRIQKQRNWQDRFTTF